jgi:hypothetical protein
VRGFLQLCKVRYCLHQSLRNGGVAPNIITVVVPSPTSSSCVRLNSIILFAAGCATSISRRMAWPSLVRTIPPMGSSSIFSMALGPRHDRMISATVFAAVMLESWALRPNCRSPPPPVSVLRLAGEACEGCQTKHTHNYHRRLHLEYEK